MELTDRSLSRRAKSYWRRHAQELFAQVPLGFEDVALHEFSEMGLQGVITKGGVTVPIREPTELYLMAMASRCATRILLRVATFYSHNFPMLYNHTKRLPWEVFLGRNPELSIRVTSSQSRLRHKAHIASVIFDGICDHLANYGLATTLSSGAQPVVHARLHQDRCTFSLDITGEPLFKRGYRTESVPAPIRENLAACLLRDVLVQQFDVIVDPFCGSGTFPIEAAAISLGLPASPSRSFAIEKTPLHVQGARAEATRRLSRASRSTVTRVMGFDRSSRAIHAAMRSSQLAAVPDTRFAVADALEIDYSRLRLTSERGLIVANLPYGKRLSTPADAKSTASAFGRHLAETAQGWTYLIISPFPDLLEAPGLEMHRQIRILNGGIAVTAAVGRVE